jgi:hypothetical protein
MLLEEEEEEEVINTSHFKNYVICFHLHFVDILLSSYLTIICSPRFAIHF